LIQTYGGSRKWKKAAGVKNSGNFSEIPAPLKQTVIQSNIDVYISVKDLVVFIIQNKLLIVHNTYIHFIFSIV
jgi:hypothetical protein